MVVKQASSKEHCSPGEDTREHCEVNLKLKKLLHLTFFFLGGADLDFDEHYFYNINYYKAVTRLSFCTLFKSKSPFLIKT